MRGKTNYLLVYRYFICVKAQSGMSFASSI
jgi:hypothetical protein